MKRTVSFFSSFFLWQHRQLRCGGLALLLGTALAAGCFSSETHAQKPPAATQLWVTVTSPPLKIYNPRWTNVRTDAASQWKPDAPWQTVAAHTQVAKLIAGNIENTTAADLKGTIDGVKLRRMDLALEIGPLVRSSSCAPKTESYGKPGETEAILQKILQAGGDLRYVAMDEPFYYGHRDDGGCHLSAAELAQQVAASVTSMRRIFPHLEVGDIEVIGADREWIPELAQWADSYRAAVGEPMAFLHCDVNWTDLAMHNLAPLSVELKQRRIPFGIIYNADADENTDLAWTQNTERHFVEIESVLNIYPDAAIFQTWVLNPARVLPESTPGTLMNLALRYLQESPNLKLSRSGAEVQGTLTHANGSPIANTSVTLTAVDVGARMWPTQRHYAGTVPEKAATAVIGIRTGIEGACICAGETGAIVGGMHYKESGKPEVVVSPVNLPIQDAPVSVRTFPLIPGKTAAPNLKQFPVTAGAAYTLDTWISATAAAEHAGYATIVFLDAAGHGLSRIFLWFSPSKQTLGTVQTDERGAFHLLLPENIGQAEPQIDAEYAGSSSLRSALAVLPSPLGQQNRSMPALEQVLPPRPSPLTSLGPYESEMDAIFTSTASSGPIVQQWDQVAHRIQMVRMPMGMILKMPDEAVARMTRDLATRHIALGLEVLATNWYHEPACGGGIEGYIDPGTANQVVAKLLKNGGSASLIAMDEPLWFGHFYSGKNSCRSSIRDLASRVAVIVKIFTAAFPNLVVGDIEPFPAISSQSDWQSAFATWVKAFQAATGTPLTFVHLDFDWGNPLLNSGPSHDISNPAAIAALARQVAAEARENGLLVGMIMNGGGPPAARSNQDWIKQAHTHIRALQASGVHFDHVLFESWDKFPTRSLPENDPATIGSLIDFYARP